MADNVNDSLKNLNQNIKDADENLAKLSKDFNVVFTEAVTRAARDAKVSIDQMFDAIAGRVGASKASKLKLLFDIVDEHGKTATPQTIQQKIDRIVNGTPNARGTKIHIGMDWVDVDTANANLRRYKEQLKLLQDMPAAYDLVNRAVNAIVSEFDKEAAAKQKIIEKNEKILEQEIAIEEKQRSKAAAQQQKQEEKQYKEEQKWYDAKAKADRENERRAGEAKYRQMSKEIAEYGKALQRQIELETKANQIRRDYNKIKSDLQGVSKQSEEYKKGQQVLQQYRQELHNVYQEQKKIDNEYKGTRSAVYNQQRLNGLRQEYEQLRRNGRQIKENKSSLESMLPTLRRLASAFGVAFSVQGLVQFGKKLVETRGEFEMQFVAMKSIIGDVDAATKIWNQTLQQSLQSPKTFKELTRYTKQLAAYRIETDKLFDTTKRLADVSAGLGVDMGRLILAYGQVKAANYLRASEVRQFTEAGVNIYGELAKYFSEIEGRAVGTAEVVERVTKRMVLFSDVEKIFQRMTDEGGTFFNMQEIQADTVLGQINKLHDAYDQMLNTIGQANQGTIRNLLETLNDLVRNWQNVAFVLKGNVNWITLIGAALYALSRNYLKGATTQTLWFSKAIMGNSKVLLKDTADIKIFSKVIGDYTLRTRIAVVATRTLQGALGALGRVAKAIWPLVVFEGAVLLIERLTRASRELKRFREELEAVTSENVGRMNEEISGYDALIKKLQKTNEGTAARKEILDEISNKYGKYLDFIVTEKTTVEELAGAYDNVVSSIRNYTAEKIREEQQQKLEKGIYDEYQDLVKSLTNKSISDAQGNQFKITKEQAKNIAKLIQQSLDKYGVVDIQSILETYFGKALGLTGAGGGNASIGNIIREYIGEYSSLNQELQNIRNDIEGQTPVFSSDAEYNDYKKRVQDANAALAEQSKKNEQIINEIKNKERAESDSWKIEDEISAQRIKNSEEELRIRKQYGLITEQQYKDAIKRLHGDLDSYETDYNTRLAKALSDQYGNTWKTSNKEARDMYNYVVSTEDALQQGTLQRNKQLAESYKGLKESLKEYKDQLSAAQKTGAGEDAVKKIQSDIDWATLMMKAIELAAQLRGLDLTDKKKGRTAHNYDSISSLISLLKEMNSEYDKLSKSAYGFAKSNEKVVESFTPAFKEIFGFAGIDISQVDTTSKRATADAMKLVIDTLDKKNLWGKFGSDGGKKARKEFVKAWSQEDVEADIDVQVRIREDFGRQMEEAFGNYELTLELQKLNIPDDVAKDLFPDFYAETLGDLQGRMRMFLKEQGENFDEDDLKKYEELSKKVESEILKYRKDKAKQYSKYLEKEYSDRAKLQMQYAEDVAFVTANFKDEKQRDNIIKNIDKKFQDDLNELNWKSFKESDFYVEMMEDISSLPAEYTQMMLDKLNEILENPETLLPRALKEAVNARQKVLDAQIATQPIKLMSTSLKEIRDAAKDLGGKGMLDTKKRVDEEIVSVQREINEYNELIVCLQNTQGEMKAYEDAVKSTEDAYGGLTLQTRRAIDMLGETHALGMFQNTMEENQKAIDEINEKEEAGGKLDSADRQRRARLQAENSLLAAQIKLINDWIEAKRKEEEIRMRQVGTEAEYKRGQGETSSDVGEQITSAGEERNKREIRVQELKGWQKSFSNFAKAFEKWNGELSNVLNKFASMGNSLYDMYDALGGETNALTEGWKEFGNTITQTITSALALIPNLVTGFISAGTSINAALGFVGLIAEAVQLVATAVTALAKLNDSYYEKEIEDQQKKIDALRDAYSRLEKQIEKTWTTIDYMNTYEQQVENIRAQIRSMESQLAAERDKKNTDDNAVRQYQRDIQDAYDQLEELEQKSIEVFGGIGEEGYRSAAQGFVEAWKSAFLETGDGLQGLQDHFDEFLQNWFVNQATMRIAGGMLERVFRQIDSAVDAYGEGGTSAMLSEIERVRDMAAAIFPDLSLALEDLAGMFGVGGEGSLSGLAAGIQGMTEEQANILEAYWNSVRMYTASIDMNVSRIAEMLGAGGPNTNPMLAQLKTIAENTGYIKDIYKMLDGTRRNLGNGQGFVTYNQ